MLIRFFETLRSFRVPVTTRELLDLLAAMRVPLVFADIDAFYQLARLTLVKDERYFDRFDRAFRYFFDGIGNQDAVFDELLPAEQLLEQLAQRWQLSPQQTHEAQGLVSQYRASLAAARRQRAAVGDATDDPDDDANKDEEQGAKDANGNDEGRDSEAKETNGEDGADHDRGNKRGEDGGEGEEGNKGNGEEGEDGEGGEGERGRQGEEGNEGEDGEGKQGKSQQGAGGEEETGERKGEADERRRRAARVWEERRFAELDDDVELGTRTFKLALRRLRKFARLGAEEELDLFGTIERTARNGGVLDIHMIPERRNNVKVLLFLDIGGSMDDHVMVCEQLFSAARSEFKYLFEHYFHNFVYDWVWTDAQRQDEQRIAVPDIVRRYGRDYKVVFVGDANMGLQEIIEKGGCIERYNSEPGAAWMKQITDHFKRIVWINPTPATQWSGSFSIVRIQRMLEGQMFPLTTEGLTQAMRYLAR